MRLRLLASRAMRPPKSSNFRMCARSVVTKPVRQSPESSSAEAPAQPDFPPRTLVKIPTGLQACEVAGVDISQFCYHGRLSIARNCPMCLVDTEKSSKPVGSCAVPALSVSDRGLSTLRLFYHSSYSSSKFSIFSAGRRGLSSHANMKSGGYEDDLEEGFSELETAASEAVQESNIEDENDDELISEPEPSGDNDDNDDPAQSDLESLDTESDSAEKMSRKNRMFSELFKTIIAAPGLSISSALDKFAEDGKDLSRAEISAAMLNLRNRRMYGRALQLSEWLEAKKQLDFVERDYASRVDLIAKVRGIWKAEQYIQKIPRSFRGEVVYRTLLANCVAVTNVQKAEEVFNKMKDLGFPITSFACNQLLLLYKRVDKKKIADILFLMEKENVKPSLFTYKILIDTKGQSNDITGMDQIVETMKAEGVELDISTQAILARHYVSGGLKEKAESMLKEMEGGNLKEHRWACQVLLPLYAELGKGDEVERVWKFCEAKPRLDECAAAIEAWGKLNKIEEAEAVFDRMLKTWKKLSSRHYSALLKVYANHKMLAKGKDLVKQMADSGCRIGPFTWDALIKLHVEVGELEKADSILQKAAQQNQQKPMFSSYMAIMEQYAKQGDIHNTEKLFHRMRQDGYVSRFRQFQTLIQAYIKAKAPAYGIRERMKADNIFPNKALAAELVHVDPFRKTTVSDLLD
ncbi:pentatricopeptide repeat-containing protein At1g80270, mitochondrial-like [Mangifera indica]|uniref:pentatricopeptide repeat-containing protein At1g80270, mitochondrial-like n=1 Tax=Mangifera indica TaxID=29780 RepID=UPI001CFA35FE|nr:pentatricopeptide repeat-containing protein At1g80270, mitochondrial-like [Mangifera indica]